MKTKSTYFMVIETSDYLHRLEANQFNLFTQKLHNGISKVLKSFNAKILLHNDNTYHVGFKSVSNCMFCAFKIQSKFKYITPKFDSSIRQLKISVSKNYKDKNAKVLAIRMCEVVKDQIVISNDIKHDYEVENKNSIISKEQVKILSNSDQRFLTNLMDYVEKIWNDSSFNISQLSEPLQYSKSQVYRKLKALTDKSPSTFIRDYRLKKAMHLLRHKNDYISNIAEQTGFKSSTYFSKCFKDRFDILPSKYLQQHT
ncbi:MAG: helix-turn-helix transcriptional regulator [Flavobacteriaceae bacterium]|nr:helix-turn-helix transcriptional regulator [Bacteroidia bacterium]NNK83537.1 helix-turn-helix transcriptional regulator [Flavobacteriaceae bacterium]